MGYTGEGNPGKGGVVNHIFFIFSSLEVSLRTSVLIPSEEGGIRDSKGWTQRIRDPLRGKVNVTIQLILAELILRGALA